MSNPAHDGRSSGDFGMGVSVGQSGSVAAGLRRSVIASLPTVPRAFPRAHWTLNTAWTGTRQAFTFSFAAVVLIQVLTGAYLVERGGFSDDAAHLMNGMVLRDYVTSAIGQSPFAFAQQYYESYPKIAPLMWPPLFHVVLGLVLVTGLPPGPTALVLIALVGAWLSWRLYTVLGAFGAGSSRWLALLFLVTTPLIASLTGTVMLDLITAALSLEAVHWLAIYVRTQSLRSAVAIGLVTGAACLTKGNGAALALAPPILLILTGRLDLLKRPGLYLSAAIVLVLGVPLLAVTASLDASLGDFGRPTAGDVLYRTVFYSRQLLTQLGPVVTACAAFGVLVVLRQRREKTEEGLIGAAIVSVLAASAAFHIFNPHKAASIRYLAPAVAPLIAMAYLGVRSALRRAEVARWKRPMAATAAVVVGVGVFLTRPPIQMGTPYGYRTLVARLASDHQLAGRRFVVVSDETGEGAFVSEAALAHPMPAPWIIRGSKLLASDNWSGQDFQLKFSSAQSVADELSALHVDYVVVDTSERSRRLAYFAQIRELPASGRLRLIRTEESGTRRLEVYTVTPWSAGDPKPIPAPTRQIAFR